MARYELSVSPDYVKHWTYKEGIREIFQNAIDQEHLNDGNTMSYDYHQGTLTISSKNSTLEKNTLLFGVTSKADNDKAIGQFGEGYKLALLVLLREGFSVEIYNYGAEECWKPKIIQSRRYGSKLLVVDVSNYVFKQTPSSNLVFKISGITKDQYHDLTKNFLFMQPDINQIPADTGRVLLNEKFKSKIFIEGLFVCNSPEKLAYGYDFNSQVLTLDRDRTAVRSFDVRWKASMVWIQLLEKEKEEERCAELLLSDALDTTYIEQMLSSDKLSKMQQRLYSLFKNMHGNQVIPVKKGTDIPDIRNLYPNLRPIVVSSIIYNLIQGCKDFKEMLMMQHTPDFDIPYKILETFLAKHENALSSEAITDLEIIISRSANWVCA